MIYHDSTVDYTVKRAGGIGTVFLGGEGIVLAHFVGPGESRLANDGSLAARCPGRS